MLLTCLCFNIFNPFSEIEKLKEKLQQHQSLIQRQQLKMKSLTAAASKSASGSSLRASPSELSGAETSVTQGWLQQIGVDLVILCALGQSRLQSIGDISGNDNAKN